MCTKCGAHECTVQKADRQTEKFSTAEGLDGTAREGTLTKEPVPGREGPEQHAEVVTL